MSKREKDVDRKNHIHERFCLLFLLIKGCAPIDYSAIALGCDNIVMRKSQTDSENLNKVKWKVEIRRERTVACSEEGCEREVKGKEEQSKYKSIQKSQIDRVQVMEKS